MDRRDSIDAMGATALVCFSLLLAFNQVVVKVMNDGFQPVFQAGLRSCFATLVLCLWIWLRRVAMTDVLRLWRWGLIAGVLFTFEFVCLFIALDLTTVSRTSILFYSMPVWMALVAHFALPGERLSLLRAVGLVLAMAGVIWVMFDPKARGEASLVGDLAALGAALGWASLGLMVRLTPLKTLRPEGQLIWQLAVSSVLFLIIAPFFGPLLRELQPIHLAGLGFQSVVIASMGFLFWFWLVSIYPASGVASFAFLAPVFSVGLGWLLLGEEIGPRFVGALVLVALGVILVNLRKARPS